jgi:ERCC4-type nuclease
MALQLRYWQHPNGPFLDRVYVNGLPVPGKFFIQKARGGRLVLHGDQDPGDVARVMPLLIAELGFDPSDVSVAGQWDALKAKCSTPDRAVPKHPATVLGGTDAAEHLDVATIKVPSPITIKVDHREPEAVIAELRKAPNTTVEICALELGDYSVNDQLFIERKSVTDFEASIIDSKRLFDQSERIKMEPGSVGVLLLEGDWTRAQRMLPQQVIGAMSFLGAIQGMSVWQTTGPVCTAYTIVKLATHLCNGLGYELGLRQHKPQSLLDAKSYVLEGCPEINAELARRLLAHFGSIAAVARASEADLRAVQGIGPKKAKRIVEVLGG